MSVSTAMVISTSKYNLNEKLKTNADDILLWGWDGDSLCANLKMYVKRALAG